MVFLLYFIIPPFQNPDEPQHFTINLVSAYGHDQQEYLQTEIIGIMQTNNFWRYIGLGYLESMPRSLSRIDFIQQYVVAAKHSSSPLYHAFLGLFIRSGTEPDVLWIYYLYRTISALFYMAAIWVILKTLQGLSGFFPGYADLGVCLVLFIPQFIFGAISVNPDALAVLSGSLFFYASLHLIMGDSRPIHVILVILIPLLAIFTDRSVIFLVFLAITLPVFLVDRFPKKQALFFLATLAICFFTAVWFIWLFPMEFYSIFSNVWEKLNIGPQAIASFFSFGAFQQTYILQLLDSFLFKFGWMAFSAAPTIYTIWRIAILSSLLGIGIFLFKTRQPKRKTKSDEKHMDTGRKLILFALLAVAIQALGLWLSQGTRNILPQGRYFFPLILPLVFLFMLGIKSLFDLLHARASRLALGILAILLLIFSSYCIWNYLIPVFHLAVQSPYTGV
jgi:hypothetical protein